MNLSLEGRYAVICGSTQGIGLAIAEELALMGANCTLLARDETSMKEALKHLDSSLRQQHGFLVADFTRPAEVWSVIEEHVQTTPVHILINNTGGPAPGPITEAKEIDILNAFSQHLICNHILTKAVYPIMKEEGYGRIINIISTSIKIPINNLGISNTVRGAVASWSKTMANEVGQFNITVNNILPGFTKTKRLENLIVSISQKKKQSIEQVESEMMSEIPMKRFGEVSEIAAVAAFLASPAASYVNGVSIAVDGGKTGTLT